MPRWNKGVPLAWCNLVHDKMRFAVSVAGVTFAVLLMFMELGFWNALLDASLELLRQFDGQLVIVSRARYTLAIRERFPTRRLEQARAVPGVKEAIPVFLENMASLWRDRENDTPGESQRRPIRVVAFDPDYKALRNLEVIGQQERLQLLNTALLDRRSKKEFGRREADITQELAQKTIQVVGTFALGTDFTADGNLIMSDRTFARFFPHPLAPSATLRLADVGLLQLHEDADPELVRAALQQVLPDDVVVYSHADFLANEKDFWQNATPIGFIFSLGMFMGFIVGLVICSQILSSEVQANWKEFATLKAIGYTNRYLTLVVLQEALLLSILGFAPALLLTELLYAELERRTDLPLFLTSYRIGMVLILTVAMCTISGLLAVNKIKKTDPAEVF